MTNNYSQTLDIDKLGKMDPLTGLYNRYYFLYTIDLNIDCRTNSNKSFVILLINLNGFKDINDFLGISIGDKILIDFSKRLEDIKKDNHILSRIDADEFAILCNSDDIIEIKSLATEILDIVRMPFLINNSTLHLNGRIGVSMYPYDGKDAEALMRSADIAMSKAEEMHGKKICFFSREMYEETKDNFLYANHLTNSISNKELSIHYQPIFNIKNCKEIVGFEALLRWKNSVLGNVPPDVFIPLAEKSGQIVSIGEWVLDHVCKQINFRQMKGYDITPISVNISVKQLEQIEFSRKTINLLNNYNIDPWLIELEITESVSSGNIDIIVDNLKDLKAFGVTISMDDFGTGFSSLGQLDFFELDKIKIDKFFIDDINQVNKKQKLLESIISLGNNLELTLVAEGIETKEQLSYLNTLDCQLGQGFLISRPLPAGEIEMFLK